MPEKLLEASGLYLNIVCDLIEAYFPSWPEVLPRNQPQGSDQPALGTDTDLRIETSLGDVSTQKTRGGGQARDAETRQQLDDRSDSHGNTINTLNPFGHNICEGSKRKQLSHHDTVVKRRAVSGHEATQLDLVHDYEQDGPMSSSTTARSSPCVNNSTAENLAANNQRPTSVLPSSPTNNMDVGVESSVTPTSDTPPPPSSSLPLTMRRPFDRIIGRLYRLRGLGLCSWKLKCRHRPREHEVGHIRLEFDVFMDYDYPWSWRYLFLAVAFPVPHS
jgi:hypothetical protein